jgi:hypothetical protein
MTTAKIAQMIGEIVDLQRIYQSYWGIYRNSDGESGQMVYLCITQVYQDIRDFSKQAREYYQQSTARRGLFFLYVLTDSCSGRIGRTTMTPFSLEFEPVCQRLKNHATLVDSAI